MKSALVLVRTPFQGFLVSKILEEEAIDAFDLLYFTQHDAQEDRHYYGRLAVGARRTAYCYAPPQRFDILTHIDFLWQARRWVHDHRHDLLLMASIDSYVLTAIANRQQGAELITFDDGTGNYNRRSPYHVSHLNWRGRLYQRLVGAPPLDDLKRRISRHYTLHSRFENIAPRHKLREIAMMLDKVAATCPGEAVMTFFIGQPLEEVLTVRQIAQLAEFARGQKIDFYLRHPRETKPLDIGVPLLDKGGLIAEETILRAAAGRPIHLIGWFSSVFFNLGDAVARKTMILLKDSRDVDEHAFLAEAIGCEVVVI